MQARGQGGGRISGTMLRRLARPLWYLGNNRLSQLGIALTTASAITFLTFGTVDFFGVHLGPYVGILAFLILPALFVLGLLLIPVGIWRRRRREVRAGRLPAEYPPISFHRPETQQTLTFVVVMSGVNLALLLAGTYGAVHHMESVAFCGTTCHVMQPEHTAYQVTAHARVPCVTCHVGPGAPGFVRSKVSGSYQLLAVTFDLYPRPIPTPIENLRPSRETCEQCHWPEKFVGDKLLMKTHFGDDEGASETKTVLLMHIGGIDALSGKVLGNHGVHVERGGEILYAASDRGRQEIPYVRHRRANGEVVEFFATSKTKPAVAAPPPDALRRMDCIDCHNRPSHAFQLPGAAIDGVLAAGLLDRSLPYIKKEALVLLQAEYGSHEQAAAAIRSGLRDFYRERYPEVSRQKSAAIDDAAGVLAGVYARNVFPAMKVGWGTYPNNLGHEDFPGCLRCHDGSHKSADGREIPSDCDSCHQLLALDDADPEILKQLSGE